MPDLDLGFSPEFQLAAQEFASRCYEQGILLRAIEVQKDTHVQRFDIGLKEPAGVAALAQDPGPQTPEETPNGPVSGPA